LQTPLPGNGAGHIRLLHIDDDEYQLATVKLFLSQLDNSIFIQSESNPTKALSEIESKNFDCVVTDYVMPEMDGLELAKRIRERHNVPIILYTGQGSEEVAERAFSIGINDYIRKETEPSHYQLLAKRIRDVVEKRRIENLQLSIIEGTRDALNISIGTSIVFANRALADLLGIEDPQRLIGSISLEWVVPEMRTRVESMIRHMSADDAVPGLLEYDVRRVDGSRVSVETSFSIIQYNGTKAILSFTRDITERKKIEEARRNSEEKFSSLVNLAPDGILTIDLKGRITFVNPALLKLTNHMEEEMVGKWFPKVGTARVSDIPMFLKTFASILRGKVPPPTEFVYVKKDGSHGWGEAHVSLISVDGKKRELLAILSDITERKRLQQELENKSKHLEIEVKEKTRELLDSERMITAGRVAAQVGHDLRGPLSTIRNAVYLGERYPEKAGDMFKIIDKAVDMSTQLLDEMRTRTQDAALNLAEVDLNSFIDNVINEVVLPVNYKIDSKLMAEARVSIDVVKMKRVLDNLFRNAIDAMPKSGTIFVSTDSDDESVTVNVKDTGCGIPDHVMKNLFKPFVTSKTNGTGLGLNFCKRVIEAHGGDIRIKSIVGVGTICSIRLPRVSPVETIHVLTFPRTKVQ
jgi:two-component system sporulation sensor kinase A